LKEGLKTYFKKYAFKNTVYADFIAEMSAAATKLDLNEVNMEDWAAEWLTSSGCSAISLKPEFENGVISKLTVVQDLYSPEPKNEQNILRT
jgi:aminopeptidase N